MIMLGIDAHKRTHTVVAVDEHGRRLGAKTTTATTTADHLELLRWADQFGPERTWAVEDCRHLSRRLERDLLAAGERLVRVPPKLMAHSRTPPAPTASPTRSTHWRSPGRRCASPTCPPPSSTGRTRATSAGRPPRRPGRRADPAHQPAALAPSRHRPCWEPKDRALTTMKHLRLGPRTASRPRPVVARIARELVAASARSPSRSTRSSASSTSGATPLRTCARSTASAGGQRSQVHRRGAGIARFRSRNAFARHNGTAPTPVWSATPNAIDSAAGNRQINAAIHRIALTQARSLPDARRYLDHRQEAGATRKEAIRSLKRRISDTIYRAMLADAQAPSVINSRPLDIGESGLILAAALRRYTLCIRTSPLR